MEQELYEIRLPGGKYTRGTLEDAKARAHQEGLTAVETITYRGHMRRGDPTATTNSCGTCDGAACEDCIVYEVTGTPPTIKLVEWHTISGGYVRVTVACTEYTDENEPDFEYLCSYHPEGLTLEREEITGLTKKAAFDLYRRRYLKHLHACIE